MGSTSTRRIEKKYSVQTLIFVLEETDYKKALRGNPLSFLTTMYDRSVIGDLYFDEPYDRLDDYIFWLTIIKRCIIAYVN